MVRGLGRLYCCQVHADTHEQRLDTANHNFYRRHAACHGDNRLLPSAGQDKPLLWRLARVRALWFLNPHHDREIIRI